MAPTNTNDTIVIQRGNTYTLQSCKDVISHDNLPVGTYIIRYNDKIDEYYLEGTSNFTVPDKIYGDTPSKGARIIETFSQRPSGTGVLLHGKKGSGKTMLANWLSSALREKGYPTLVVSGDFHDVAFKTFMMRFNQPMMILFDEFEKIYNEKNHQEHLLSMFHGVMASQTLFVLTVNDIYKVDTNMLNRPGRLYYSLEYQGVDSMFIEEYCIDKLLDKAELPGIQTFAKLFDAFTHDMLETLVEEMNRFGESASEASKMLNMNPEDAGSTQYKVRITTPDGFSAIPDQKTFKGNPFDRDLDKYFYLEQIVDQSNEKVKSYYDDEGEYLKETSLRIFGTDLVSFSDGMFTFVNQDGFKVQFFKTENSRFDWRAF